VGFQGRTI